VHDGECPLSNGPPGPRSLRQDPVRGNSEHSPIARLAAGRLRKAAVRSYRCSFNCPTVYFANAFSLIKLSGGEDFGD
jgi:hypothetical protein